MVLEKHIPLAFAYLVILKASAQYRPPRESCSLLGINTARIPRFDIRKYDGVILYETLLLDRRSLNLVSQVKIFTQVNRANVFDLHEVGKVRGTDTCGALSYEGAGKTAINDPCYVANITRPFHRTFGEALFVPIDKETLGIAFCDVKKNGICVDGFLSVLTSEDRLTGLRKYNILQDLEYFGLLKEFGIKRNDLLVVNQRLNTCEFSEDIQKMIRLSKRRANRKRKHYRY